MTIKDFVAYVKQTWANRPSTSSPLSAERLNHIENGVKGNSNGIEALAAAVVSQITNDPNKIASMAALFAVNEVVKQQSSDLAAKFPTARYLRLKSDPYVSDAEVRIEESRCNMQLHNYATAIVTKLVILDGKAILQKYRSAGGTDTYIGEVVLGEVK